MWYHRSRRSLAFLFLVGLLLTGCASTSISAATPAYQTLAAPIPLKIELPSDPVGATCQGHFEVVVTITNTGAEPLTNVMLKVPTNSTVNILQIVSAPGNLIVELLPNEPQNVTFKGDLISPVKSDSKFTLTASAKTTPTTTAVSVQIPIKVGRFGLKTETIPAAKLPPMLPTPTLVQSASTGVFLFNVIVFCNRSLTEQRVPVSLTLTPTHATITSPVRIEDGKSTPEVKGVVCSSQVKIGGTLVRPFQQGATIKAEAFASADLGCIATTLIEFPAGK